MRQTLLKCVVAASLLSMAGATWAQEPKKDEPPQEKPAKKEKKTEEAGTWTLYGEGALGFNAASDDEERFREVFQLSDTVVGGVRRFSARYFLEDLQFTANVRAVYEADFGVNLALTKPNLGYAKVWFDQLPRYFDSSNVAYNWAPFLDEASNDDLRLDTGRFGAEIGLRHPDYPTLTVGIERIRKDGETNLFWGGHTVPDLTSRTDPQTGTAYPYDLLHAYVIPLFREVDTAEDRVYAEGGYQIGPAHLKLHVEWREKEGSEDYDEPWYVVNSASTTYTPTAHWRYDPNLSNLSWGADLNVDIIQSILKAELAYTYLKAENNSEFNSDTLNADGSVNYSNHALNVLPGTKANNEATTDRYTLRLEWTLANVGVLWGGIELRQSNPENDSVRYEEGTEGAAGGSSTTVADEIWAFTTENDEDTKRFEVGFQVTCVPRTTINLSTEFEDSEVDYDWTADFQDGPDTSSVPDEGNWRWKAKGKTDLQGGALRVSYKVANWWSLNPYYRYRQTDLDVSESLRSFENKTGDPEYTVSTTSRHYPGQIKDLERTRHTVGFRTKLIPCQHATLRPYYEFEKLTETNDDEQFEDLGKRRIHRFGLGLDVQPAAGWLVSADGSWTKAETETPAEDHTNSFLTNPLTGVSNTGWRGGLIEAFNNSYWTVYGTIQYLVDQWAFTLNSGLNKMESNWDTDFVWVGAGVRRSLSENAVASFDYKFATFDESGNDGFNDFDAHLVMLGIELGWGKGATKPKVATK